MNAFIFRIIAIFLSFGVSTELFSIVRSRGNVAPTLEVLTPSDTFSAGEVRLSANASDGDGSIKDVCFYIDEQLVFRDVSEPYEVFFNIAPGSHSYTVVAKDNRRGMTVSHRQLQATSNEAPEIQSIQPKGGSVVAFGPTTISVDAMDPDGTIAAVRIALDGVRVAELTTAPFEVVTTPARGEHTITVEVEDNEGASTSATQDFSVEPNKPPVIASIFPEAGEAIIEGNISFGISATDSDGTIASTAFFLNGVEFAIFAGAATPTSLRLTPGSYTFDARTTDNEGASSVAFSEFEVVAIPNTAPSVVFITPQNMDTAPFEHNIAVEISASDAESGFQLALYIDGTFAQAFLEPPYQTTVSGLVPGPHTFTAYAIDEAEAETFVSVTVIVNEPQPIAEVLLPPGGGLVRMTYGELLAGRELSPPETWEFYVNDILLPAHFSGGETPTADDAFYVYALPDLSPEFLTVQPGPNPVRMDVVDATFNEDAEEILDIFDFNDTIGGSGDAEYQGYNFCGFQSTEFAAFDLSNPWQPRFLENTSLVTTPGFNCALFSVPGLGGATELVVISSPDYIEPLAPIPLD